MTTDDRPEPASPAPAFEAATFRAHLGTTLDVELGTERVPLRLVDVAGERTGGGFVRFSVLFHGPPDRLLAQGSYTFHHQALGSLVLFIVPIVGSDAERIVYEACFSQPAPAKLPAAPVPPTPPREEA
jgi:hypothetical protein